MLRRFLAKTHLRLSIRQQLLLVSMVLLVIPVIGLQYVNELETFLRQDQENRLLENAKVIATVIASQARLTNEIKAANNKPGTNHRFIRPLRAPILLDGYDDDWAPYIRHREDFRPAPGQQSADSVLADPPVFSLLTGHYQRKAYFLFQVRDKHRVYRSAQQQDVKGCDHLIIATQLSSGKFNEYIISTHSPGQIQAVTVQLSDEEDEPPITRVEPRITAVWSETASGYNVEVRIPESVLGERMALAVVDVDDPTQREHRQILSASNLATDKLIPVTTPSPPLDAVLRQYALPQTRAWLLNQRAQILAVAGSIYDDNQDIELLSDEDQALGFMEAIYGFIRLIYQAILPEPTEFFVDDTARASVLKGSEVATGLSGSSAIKWRLTRDKKVNILRAVQPITWQNEVLGVIAVERNSNSILLLQNRAMEILLNTSVIVFLISTLTLIAFATRLSYRIGRLRDDAEAVISPDGRVTGDMANNDEQDELGDLRRSYVTMLDRLKEYNRYLESMAGKLSHELRTPITVVKSSLENLELSHIDTDSRAYVERARDGVDRLNHILTRMSEATRLEQTLSSEEKEDFPLNQVVSGCVSAYQSVHKDQEIRYLPDASLADKTLRCHGSADLIAQMLDKLVNNAMDFALADTPVDVVIAPCELGVALFVRNCGTLLPDAMQTNLFDSMVSIRKEKAGKEPHLGLGLYIVRLIAEFHNGKAFARNMLVHSDVKNVSEPKCEGVEIGVELPLNQYDEPDSTEQPEQEPD